MACPDGEDMTDAPVGALIVVDMQVGFVTGPHAVPDAARVVGAVDVLLDAARRAGAFVVHLRNDGPPGAVDEPGTSGWQLLRTPSGREPVVCKSEDDGFAGTELGALLDRAAVRRLAMCGVLSDMCVAATARSALARGYGVVLPHDAHATYDVPAGPGGSPSVPAALAARAAEWSLGDRVEIVGRATNVRFAAG